MDTRGPARDRAPPRPTGWACARALTPGTSWQWQIDGSPIDETVLDAVTNPKKMYDIDMFTTTARPSSACTPRESKSSATWRPAAGRTTVPTPARTRRACWATRWAASRTNGSSTSARSRVLQPIIAARFDLAKAKGCDGIEPDLDDTYNGYDTGFPLTMQHQLAFNKAVADLAHARGMSIGLKNGASRGRVRAGDGAVHRLGAQRGVQPVRRMRRLQRVHRREQGCVPGGVHSLRAPQRRQVCPADNAANFDGILKLSSASLSALPRIACRNG